MPICAGDRLGPYEIGALVGAGGMGEVYRARDTKLGREVALKVLPNTFAGDPERMARFQREAEFLASLNHPNIAAIYGLEESNGIRALVMELVEGPTLAERIGEQGMPLEEALPIARQIAGALEYAHEKGIVHRDLKPANVKLTVDGDVKVLDFGLARALEAPAPSAGNPSLSPTFTLEGTRAGVILGTAAYMAPEQASGKPVDKRADIWSFGVVLWEMLTGHRLFDGETISHTLADVLRAEIDLNKLPAGTPVAIRNLLRRCLDRDVKDRLRDIGEARIAIQRYLANPNGGIEGARPAEASPTRLPWVAAAVLLLAALGLGYVAYRHITEEARVLRFSVLSPEKATADIHALSTDGRRLAFVGTQDGRHELWVRELDSLVARLLPATDGATYPFWSPDSRTIGFFQGGKLKKIDAGGGPAITLSDAPSGRGGSWSQNGVILFVPTVNVGIYRVSAAGGAATQVTTMNPAEGENAHRMPWFLPDGHHFLYTARNIDPEKNAVYVADLDSEDRKRILAASSNAAYAAPGYLLFLRERTLMAQPFDASSVTTRGDAVPIAEELRYDGLNLVGRFSVSQNGVLAYTSGSFGGALNAVQLTWFDRTGKAIGTIGMPGVIQWPAISPDGHTVAFDRVAPPNGSVDIWLYDQARGTESRFTFNSPTNSFPVWSPDGSHIAFESIRPGLGDLYQRATSGAAQDELLDKFVPGANPRPTDWSRDGRYIIEHVFNPKTNADISVLPLFGDRKAIPYLHMDYNEGWGKLSPDGKWLAYQSDETKQYEIYVQSFPNPGGKWQVSTSGGIRPVWSRDGRELFFISYGKKMMAVEVKSGAKFEAGVPKPLFDTRIATGNYWFDVSKDGHFLIPSLVAEGTVAPISVVVNWTAGIK
jgi:eukaryotic-like serine/threonine-protein kinase